ncbi:transcription antitermination factor NusB [Candidatus Woesebacteria bacterium]|nr:transcription antitermination factor NusB [Candidatus Woesebacteria bacterium]
MKTRFDPRHQKRRQIVRELFSYDFAEQKVSDETLAILKHKKKIDDQIKSAAQTWPIEKINKVDLAILRLAIHELQTKVNPPKVIIDEAVELGKEFGSENTASFVNGVLGTILKHEG